ncbi:6-phosphogluconolactonase [Lichtheimia hyalospora FSU 10163]|nr:6-phosphogluconolactonase [Lichtheimia hyalospora FSU 10163]
MTATSIRIFANSDLVSAGLDTFIEQQSHEAINSRGVFHVAVSGGSLPKILARHLVNNSRIAFEKWHIFFADERCVPLDHPDSNYLELRKELLDRLPLSRQPCVHMINQQHIHAPATAAADYEQQLCDHFKGTAYRFDVILLGMGPDGHCCSLFPGHSLLNEHHLQVASIQDSPKPPSKRITFTLPIIHRARKKVFVATGQGKQEMLLNMIHRPEMKLPCQLVGPATWFVDQAAAALLPPPSTLSNMSKL